MVRWGGTSVAIAVATLVIACVLLLDPLDLGISDCLGNFGIDSTHIFAILVSVPHFILRTSKKSKNEVCQDLHILFNALLSVNV